MRITRIAAENFLSYESLDLDLSALEQVGIVGANGSGKSALLDMFTWCLFGVGRGSADEMLRENTDHMSVTVEFELAGIDYSVTRERSLATKRGESTLSFLVGGVQTTGHAIVETQAQIAKHLGLSLDALLAGPIMVQMDGDDPHDLMHLRQADRMDLLIGLFNLGIYEAYHARAKDWHSRESQALAGLEARLTEFDDLIAGELEAKREEKAQEEVLATLTDVIDRKTEEAAVLREQAAALIERGKRQEQLDADIAKAQRDLDTAGDRIATLEHAKVKRQERLARDPILPPVNDVDAIDERLALALPEVATLPDLKEQRGSLQASYKQQHSAAKVIGVVPCQEIRDDARLKPFADMCLECQFLVDAKAGRDALPEIVEKGKSLTVQIERLEEKAKYVDVLSRERREASDQLAAHRLDRTERESAEEFLISADEEIARESTRRTDAAETVAALNAERLRIQQDVTERDRIAGSLRQLTEQIEDARRERAQVDRRLADAHAAVLRIADAKERKKSVDAERRRVHNRVEALRLLVTAFHRDGIPKLILENGLPMIEDRANELLDRMPGAWRVEVATQRELKSGGTREALDVVITAAGVERPYRMLSGGERFRVDFALRMALATVLARRSGTHIETLWLDEGWGSQDREGREALLEAIASVSDEFRLMLIVSHVPEVTDAMPQRLEVTKENGVSSAAIAA